MCEVPATYSPCLGIPNILIGHCRQVATGAVAFYLLPQVSLRPAKSDAETSWLQGFQDSVFRFTTIYTLGLREVTLANY